MKSVQEKIIKIIKELNEINARFEKEILNPFPKLKHYQCEFCNWKGTKKEIYAMSGNNEEYLICPVCGSEVNEIKN